jgi:hypothetical protein
VLENPISYYALGINIALHILGLYFIRKLWSYYYNKHVNSSESDIEQLILRQREILEEVKQKNNYYMTHELVEKYERSIKYMERQFQLPEAVSEKSLLAYYDYISASSNVAKIDVGVQVNIEPVNSPRQTSPAAQQKPVVVVDDQAISKMMGMMTHLIRQQHYQQQIREKERTQLPESVNKDLSFEDVSDRLPLPSLKNKKISKESSSSTEQPETDETQGKNTANEQAKSIDTTAAETDTLDRKSLQQLYQAIQHDMQQLEEQRLKLQRKEQALKERERILDVALRPPATPSDLYSPTSIGNYQFEPTVGPSDDIKRVVPKLGLFDRIIDKLIGQSPDQCIALICCRCFSHNGLMMMEDAKKITRFRCWECKSLNVHSPNNEETMQKAPKVQSSVAEPLTSTVRRTSAAKTATPREQTYEQLEKPTEAQPELGSYDVVEQSTDTAIE